MYNPGMKRTFSCLIWISPLVVGVGMPCDSDELPPAASTQTSASFKEVADYTLSYKEGAEAGNAQAQYNLGAAYRWGVGIDQNLEQAVIWIRRSAEKRFAPAERVLATLYEKGEGVPQSNVEAYRWSQRAALQGDALAQDALPALKAKLSREELIHSAESSGTRNP
jgi:hypothetical protein